MAEEIPQSHIRLATTATAGSGGEHSPYARRVLSSGYKGLIQGSIGGATLYGTFGAIVGTVVGVGLLFTPVGVAGLAAIPLIAGAGALKGASTFGTIAAQASMHAETAEINERRRAISERIQETTSQKEADALMELLHNEGKESKPEHMFHWKALAIGILIGAAVGFAFTTPLLIEVMHFVIGDIALKIAASGVAAPAIGAAIGGAAGATIGIDRYYIRKWFDVSENVVHDREKSDELAIARQREASRLSEIARNDKKDTMRIETYAPQAAVGSPLHEIYRSEDSVRPRVKVEATGAHVERLKSIEEAMQVPVV